MRYPDIRRSKSLGASGTLHSYSAMNKVGSPDKAVKLLWPTTTLTGEPLLCYKKTGATIEVHHFFSNTTPQFGS